MRLLMLLLGAVVLAFVATPLIIVVPMSFSTAVSLEFPPPGWWTGYYAAYFSDARWTRPTLNSLGIAAAVAVLTVILVTPATFALVRHRFAGKALVNLLLMLPLAVPHIVMAIGYYAFLADVRLLQTFPGIILAHTALSVPMAFLVLSANLKGFDRTLERAAMSLGASPAATFRHVTLPVLWPGFAAAALFAFVQSFDETVVALFISGRDTETLPRRMFDSIRTTADPVIAVVSTLLFVAVAALVILPILWRGIARRRSEARP
ncbi:ABC transporter permease [Roseomonas sp. SSH11]|uniref:ABC transporter permease n=1 Tax=Pararoseomonas baculiformis TaxID=2820812 RepID=A0ABS4AK90_9PROT|nr:ABC transporter permease [Pararoseomonas baculiformis]MBP0446903.1 ABC transporter permease [Pararoseomonas baculiformis]